jgi:hypothetical protein
VQGRAPVAVAYSRPASSSGPSAPIPPTSGRPAAPDYAMLAAFAAAKADIDAALSVADR